MSQINFHLFIINLNGDHTSKHSCLSIRCAVGYTKSIDTKDCEDINECDTGEANCDINNQACVNTIGSYKCFTILDSEKNSECEEGFRYQARIDQCVGEFNFLFRLKAEVVSLICCSKFSLYWSDKLSLSFFPISTFSVVLFIFVLLFSRTNNAIIQFRQTSMNARRDRMIVIGKHNYV